jgi:hypothetical protein
MLWDEAEATIKAHVEEQWALGAYAAIALTFDNEFAPDAGSYMLVNIEGNGAEKSIYGTTGYRQSIDAGIVFFHCFVPSGTGKAAAVAPVVAMTGILELMTLANVIKLDGGNPPSPADPGDSRVPASQPGGNYYRCSGSVPFILIGTR